MVNLHSHYANSVILIVDDQIDNIEVLATALELQGYSITFALSGQEALERLEAIEIDLILLDLFMPDMDGLQVCDQIKANPKYTEIPVLFLTASHEEEHLIEAFNKGAADYVTKPFKAAEIVARVKTHIELRQKSRELKRTKDKLDTIITYMQDGIIVVDNYGIIKFANPATAQMFAQPLSNLLGHPLGLPIVTQKLTTIDIVRLDGTLGTAEITVGEAHWDDQPVSIICLRDKTVNYP